MYSKQQDQAWSIPFRLKSVSSFTSYIDLEAEDPAQVNIDLEVGFMLTLRSGIYCLQGWLYINHEVGFILPSRLGFYWPWGRVYIDLEVGLYWPWGWVYIDLEVGFTMTLSSGLYSPWGWIYINLIDL